MVSEPDIGRCANKEAEPRKGVDMRRYASRDVEPRRGVDWGEVPHLLEKGTSVSEDAGPRRGVDCEIPHWLERKTKHSLQGCGNLSQAHAL